MKIEFKKQNSWKVQNTYKDKELVFQKNRYKMQTYINTYEKNNEQTRIIQKKYNFGAALKIHNARKSKRIYL